MNDDAMLPPAFDFPTKPCGTCGAPVIWATTGAGKPMPVDAVPVKGGNILLSPPIMSRPIARVYDSKKPPFAMGYAAHFATCPHAEQHRKRGTGK
jgi:hypothetical protein